MVYTPFLFFFPLRDGALLLYFTVASIRFIYEKTGLDSSRDTGRMKIPS